MKSFLITIISLLLFTFPAASQTLHQIQPNKINNLSYNSDTDNPTEVLIRVRLNENISKDLIYAISFESGISGRVLSGPDPAINLNYELYDPGFTPPRVLPAWDPSLYPGSYFTGLFPAKSKKNAYFDHLFTIVIPGGAIIPAGFYSGSFDINLYSGPAGTTPVYKESIPFPIMVKVTEEIAVSLVPAEAPFNPYLISQTVDFGFLEEGDGNIQRSLDLIVRSNTYYGISICYPVDPLNPGFNLKLAEDGSSIPYTFTIGQEGETGTEVYADQTGPFVTGSWTEDGEDRYRLYFTIPLVPENPTAGTYTDILTITIKSN